MTRLALLACLIAAPAVAQDGPPCGPRENIAGILSQQFGEEPAGMGVSDEGPMLEVFANPTTGTWTALASDPGGQSCIVSYGQGWMTIPGAPV